MNPTVHWAAPAGAFHRPAERQEAPVRPPPGLPSGLPGQEELVTGISFGDKSTPEDPESRGAEPAAVRRGVGVAPVHLRLHPEPPARSGSPGIVTDDGQEKATRAKPAIDAPQEGKLSSQRHVDQRIQHHDALKPTGREPDRGHVGANEVGGWDERTRPSYLYVGDVDAGHLETTREKPDRGLATPTSQVQHGGVSGKLSEEGAQPHDVLSVPMAGAVRARPGGAIDGREFVPPGPDYLLRRFPVLYHGTRQGRSFVAGAAGGSSRHLR